MSAQDHMRRMLDELMGTRRNGEDERPEKLSFRSPRVCKSFLLNCCPHEILTATRGDIGECKKVHDVALRADFENSNREDEPSFQREALIQLRSFVSERERRTHFAKVRLAETQEILNAEENNRIEKIKSLIEQIDQALAEAGRLGVEGDVDGSLKMMERAEELKKEKEAAEEAHRNATPASITQQQKLRVCEVCTSYLGVHDNDRRLADHFNGKLHLGFITIREKLKELEDLLPDLHIKAVVSNEFEKDNAPPIRSHSPDEPKHHKRYRSRSRSRSRERRHGHKSSSHKHYHKHRHSRR